MSLIDNYNLTNFASLFPPDKIALEGEVQYSKPTGAGTGTTETISNPLGYACFITIAWSIDGTNYYGSEQYPTGTSLYSVNGSVSDSTISFYIRNQTGSTQTFYIKYALDTIT
jgi:hypothetical protein